LFPVSGFGWLSWQRHYKGFIKDHAFSFSIKWIIAVHLLNSAALSELGVGRAPCLTNSLTICIEQI
jgi:hypothetical protein